ncbi:hypothetical protein I3760_10G116800 [Carya illinoinensis]|nr:hypothetical protein I3760_10G116800 [Carya illinoinensis]KAG2685253.1 hypothetical protein I3760_10G116800 [Carya illinoinensis]
MFSDTRRFVPTAPPLQATAYLRGLRGAGPRRKRCESGFPIPSRFCGIGHPNCTKSERFRPKRAAVLVCLFEGDAGDLGVILTKRFSKLSTHSGEVSLPGGKAEEGDKDDGDTATREAREEIGLDPSLVNVVTVLEPFLSKVSTFRIVFRCHFFKATAVRYVVRND